MLVTGSNISGCAGADDAARGIIARRLVRARVSQELTCPCLYHRAQNREEKAGEQKQYRFVALLQKEYYISIKALLLKTMKLFTNENSNRMVQWLQTAYPAKKKWTPN